MTAKQKVLQKYPYAHLKKLKDGYWYCFIDLSEAVICPFKHKCAWYLWVNAYVYLIGNAKI